MTIHNRYLFLIVSQKECLSRVENTFFFFIFSKTSFLLDEPGTRKVLRELVRKPCSLRDIRATLHLKNPQRDIFHACDGLTRTFYHSSQTVGTRNPFWIIHLRGTFSIETITVVNVHTGTFCLNNARDCTERLNGAKVEVLQGMSHGIYLPLTTSRSISYAWNTDHSPN